MGNAERRERAEARRARATLLSSVQPAAAWSNPMQVSRAVAARRLLPIGFVLVAVALLTIACGADGQQSQPNQPSAPVTVPAQGGPWSTLAPLLQPRSEMAVAEVGGKVYVIGGYPPGRIPSNVVQVYDPAANSWSLGPATPQPLHHSVAVAVGSRLFLIGGEIHGAGTGHPPGYINEVLPVRDRR